MNWEVRFNKSAEKQFYKLDRQAQKTIRDYLLNRVSQSSDPKIFGKPLVGIFTGLWRYRVGDYRIICDIQDGELIILVVLVGHRKNVYDK
jgi:mRNA interferase RelE/StbE